MESINLEAEEKLLVCSERGCSVSAQTETSKTELAFRPRVVGSHLELSSPDRKAMNYKERDLKVEVIVKDLG